MADSKDNALYGQHNSNTATDRVTVPTTHNDLARRDLEHP